MNLFYQRQIEIEYSRRRKKNPSYSLRAFARFLGVPAGRLSEILSKKRGLSRKLAHQFADRLELSPQDREIFIDSIKSSKKKLSEASQVSQLSQEVFFALADWEHFAILNLIQLDNFRSDIKWISQRLAVPPHRVQMAINRLEHLGLMKKGSRGYVRINKNLTTTTDVTSAALRRSHRQTIEQAAEALDSVPVELRDITSITMPIDLQKISEAKEIIKKFRRKLADKLSSGKKTEVYNLNIQLVPVTRLNLTKR